MASESAATGTGELVAAPDRDWHEWRRGGIGGSDAAALIGRSSYSSPYRLWAEKVGLIEPTETTPRQRVGQVLEAAVAQLFTEATGLHIAGEQTWCQHPDVPILRCTVDGFVVEAIPTPTFCDDGCVDDVVETYGAPLGTCEIKTDARFGWDELPDNIRAQVVWQLGVTGHRHAWIPVLHGGFRFEVYELEWDDDAEADWTYMVERAVELWQHVESGEPPMVDGSDATAATLRQLYPNHEPGETVELDTISTRVAAYEALKITERDTARKIKQARNEIAAAFGDAEVGTIDGRPAFTFRKHEVREHTVAAYEVRTLRAVKRKER